MLNASLIVYPFIPPFPVMPVTSTLAATHTATFSVHAGGGPVSEGQGTLPDSIRVVSNVPVSASMSLWFTTTDQWLGFECTPQLP